MSLKNKRQELNFDEFKFQSKEEWANLAQKTLKERPLQSLNWRIDDHIQLDPYYTKDEKILSNHLIGSNKDDNNWLLGENFDSRDPSMTNKQIIEALNHGLNSPCIFDPIEVSVLLDQINVDYIFPIFKDCSADFINHYLKFISSQDHKLPALTGGIIAINEFEGPEIDDSKIQLAKAIASALPLYYYADVEIYIDPSNIAQSLKSSLDNLIKLINHLISNKLKPRVICSIELDDNYVRNVALLRALKIMTINICNKFNLTHNSIILDVYVTQTALDTQLAMIGATSKTLAAVFGGADRITISSVVMNMKEEETVIRRMTRNIHHIMKMECGFDKVADPLAGSYTIEKLTGELLSKCLN